MNDRVNALREAFDRSFSEDPVIGTTALHDFLNIRCNGDPYAVDLDQIGGLHDGKQIRPLPSPLSQLLGIAGFRGTLVPVYDLAALLGYSSRKGRYTPRWMMLAAGAQSYALAFDELEGYMQRPLESLSAADGPSARAHIRAAMPGDDGPRALLDIPSLTQAISSLVEVLPKKE